jgi:UDP-glucose 4-epimerase
MFDIPAVAFRFGNVIGPRQTHGVGYDFIRRLKDNPNELRILGDGLQSKTYVHVIDIVEAVLLAEKEVKTKFEVFNVGTDEYVTVNEIAEIAIKVSGMLKPVTLLHTGGDRGWKGDVPVLRLNTQAIRAIGWQNKYSTKDALKTSMEAMLKEIS